MNNSVVARTVPDDVARDLVTSRRITGTGMLGNEEYAIATMLSSGSARVYTLTSIDAAARAATSDALVAARHDRLRRLRPGGDRQLLAGADADRSPSTTCRARSRR